MYGSSGRARSLGTSRGSLRGRIVVGILSITGLAVVLFAIPLGVAISRLDRSQQSARLQTDATRVAALVPDNPLRPGGQPLPGGLPSGSIVGIYAPDGSLAGGEGPAHSSIARAAVDGRSHSGSESGQLVASVPVPSDTRVVAVIRAAVNSSAVSSRTHRSWAAMAALGSAILVVATALAIRQARRIAVPLERLTAATRALGDGNFAVSLPPSGIREADLAAAAVHDTAARLGQLVERERTFTSDVSHQLRTPLTGLLLGLESAIARREANRDDALQAALDRGRHLESTIDDLLNLRREVRRSEDSIDITATVGELAGRWGPLLSAESRRLVVVTHGQPPPVSASEAALRQALDVLLDNALKHGAGTVTLSLQEFADAVAVDVSDEGPGIPADPETAFVSGMRTASAHGHGLTLARSLIEADGGRLVLKRSGPGPVFEILLPTGESVVASVVHFDGAS